MEGWTLLNFYLVVYRLRKRFVICFSSGPVTRDFPLRLVYGPLWTLTGRMREFPQRHSPCVRLRSSEVFNFSMSTFRLLWFLWSQGSRLMSLHSRSGLLGKVSTLQKVTHDLSCTYIHLIIMNSDPFLDWISCFPFCFVLFCFFCPETSNFFWSFSNTRWSVSPFGMLSVP